MTPAAKARLGFTGQVLSWLVILAVTAVLAVAVAVPRLAGAVPYAVLTTSMEPTMPAGTLAVVKPVEVEDVVIGDVITYQLESGKPTVVTHRVIGQGFDGEGEVVLRTQGDANDSPDRELVRAVQVRGEVWYSVPYLGYANNVLTGQERQVGVYGVAAGLLGYALLSFVLAARDARRRPQVTKEGLAHV